MTPFCSTFFSFHVFVFSGCSDSSIYITACLSALVAMDFLHLCNVPSDLLGFGDQMAKIVRIEYWVRVNRQSKDPKKWIVLQCMDVCDVCHSPPVRILSWIQWSYRIRYLLSKYKLLLYKRSHFISILYFL